MYLSSPLPDDHEQPGVLAPNIATRNLRPLEARSQHSIRSSLRIAMSTTSVKAKAKTTRIQVLKPLTKNGKMERLEKKPARPICVSLLGRA